MQYIVPVDFLIALIYIFILYILIKTKATKYVSARLNQFYVTGFFLHMIGALLYAMVIQYYYGYGDSLGFFRGSNFLSTLTKNELTVKYFFYGSEELSNLFLTSETGDNIIGAVINNNANLIIIKISAALSIISFNKYLIISLFFGFFSFTGLWRLFIVFNEVLENKVPRLLAITVLYIPSIWFWGSGLIKDSICIGCVGFVVNAVYKIFIKKKYSVTDIILLIACFYTLFLVKNYIAGTLLIATMFFSIHNFMKRRKSGIERWLYSILILVAGVLIITLGLESYINNLIDDSKTAIDTFKNVYESMDAAGDAGSGFTGKNIDFTFSGIILNSPASIFTTLYRPFLWEIKNLMMVFSSLESLAALVALLFLLFKTRLRFFSYIFSSPFLLFSFIMVIILSLVIGFTTFNFGTMVRYRIPILPFYAFILTSIYVKHKDAKLVL